LREIDVKLYFVELRFGDDGALFGFLIQWIALLEF